MSLTNTTMAEPSTYSIPAPTESTSLRFQSNRSKSLSPRALNTDSLSSRGGLPQISPEDVSGMCQKHVKKLRPGLKRFYPDPEVDLSPSSNVVAAATQFANTIMGKGCAKEITLMMSLLSLYDLVMLIDNSISVELCQARTRIATLEHTMKSIAATYWLTKPANHPQPGVTAVRFLNPTPTESYTNVRPSHIERIIKALHFSGDTPIGTQLKRKILDKYVRDDMKRPIIVIVITDGEIEGEPREELRNVIVNQALKLLKSHPDGHHAVTYQFAKIGDDEEATKLVKRLDEDEDLSPYIDCMHHELEQLQKVEEEEVDVGKKWKLLGKLLLGSVDQYFDDLLFEDDSNAGNNSGALKAELKNSDVEKGEDIDLGDTGEDEGRFI